ncbi:hypothetical protein Tco_0343937, partial [Tanacetum coccineum]
LNPSISDLMKSKRCQRRLLLMTLQASSPNDKRRQILVKVRWNSKRGPEFTWEREDQFKKKYPHLFTKTTPSSSAAL